MKTMISVVIPAYNAADHLERCLTALSRSVDEPLECIVVDDGSTDDTVTVAKSLGAEVLSTGGRCGPSRARNLGAYAAKGEILFFVDADVCVRPDTVGKIAGEFAGDMALDAVMGAYDVRPDAQNFMSQYRNLMHSFVHRSGRREATTFWSGCGAIRREVFLNAGGFDETFKNPAIEDIDLGYRLHGANRKLALNPGIEVKHLKSWSLRGLVKTDFLQRALPWSELTLRTGRMPNDLNIKMSQRVSVAISFLLVLLAAYLAVKWHGLFLTPLFAAFFLVLSAYWVETVSQHSKVVSTLMALIMGTVIVLAYVYHMFAIIPLMIVAWLALFLRHRYAYAQEARRRWTGAVAGGFCLLVIAFAWTYMPIHPTAAAFSCLLLVLLYLNKGFYLFLAARRGKLFALAAIPFHILYYLYSGLAFMVAVGRHVLRIARGSAPPEPAKSRAAAAR